MVNILVLYQCNLVLVCSYRRKAIFKKPFYKAHCSLSPYQDEQKAGERTRVHITPYASFYVFTSSGHAKNVHRRMTQAITQARSKFKKHYWKCYRTLMLHPPFQPTPKLCRLNKTCYILMPKDQM